MSAVCGTLALCHVRVRVRVRDMTIPEQNLDYYLFHGHSSTKRSLSMCRKAVTARTSNIIILSTKATQHVLHHEFAQRWHPRQARPLTAYHIFLQIEREYIIQTSEGEIADKSSLDNKIYQNDVPNCYKNIRLLRDGYAGPGKHKKRKHRTGFLESAEGLSVTANYLPI